MPALARVWRMIVPGSVDVFWVLWLSLVCWSDDNNWLRDKSWTNFLWHWYSWIPYRRLSGKFEGNSTIDRYIF